jgi:hypothetical protein
VISAGQSRRAQAADLLVTLNQRGIQLSAEAGAIRFRAPSGALDATDRTRITELREDILALLTGAQPRRLPLSDQQLRLWLLHERQGRSPEYQMTAAFRMSGPVDLDSLQAAVDAVVRRHPALRSVIRAEDGLPVMVARPAGAAAIAVADAPGPSDESVRQIIDDIASEPMDLAQGPLLRVAVVRLADGWAGALVIHHIVSDDYSIRLVCGQVLACYAALSHGGQLPPGWAAAREAWPETRPSASPGSSRADPGGAVSRRRAALSAAGAPRLPAPHPVPPVAPRAASCRVRVLGEPGRQAWAQARQASGVTTLVLTLALAGVAVAAAGGPADLLIGTPCSGRENAAEHEVVGYYAGTVVVRVSVASCATFGDLLDQVTTDVGAGLALWRVPYETLAGTAAQSPHGGWMLWVVTYAVEPVPEASGLGAETLAPGTDRARHDLRIALVDRLDKLELRLTHRIRAVDGGFAGNVAVALETLHRSVPPRPAMLSEVVSNLRQAAGSRAVDDAAASEDLIAFARRRRLRSTR